MIPSWLKTSLLVLSLLSTVASCGFRLRGSYLIAPELQTLNVTSVDNHGELTREVKRHLANNQITIVPNFDANVPELYLMQDKLDRRTLSLFPNGQVAEYELIYTVRYQIRFKDKSPREFVFELNRDYQEDPRVALAKSRELNLMLKEMRIEAADKILRDMASISVD
ncbi:LPS-assembly lipoprotein LptE [Thalassotalea agarivorans]|uniref:LPS-assembly lipoprotein LptE n=1 Tax=Thalassotalea agarivorans TaxID=349064 RepID=A0A1I0I0D1_THASX|nr:LPS assembly lipoprotein LptE [Thalassotalea agarivorans]SET89064.1 LPS-assembly lipoprotein [Thalassotalea agarivorans]